ncbi:MAG: DNA polymerase III subunit gamma/tau [Thermodesulfobacteriaceae bacterium]|nr:DNA polymerase III subunit gamma/tau [Thermodesulfobacteriaceae bacterium]MCX8041771.1 DNA polymerase III subunit gamma/tau [Thermodesulfobacteriaceae bacterium]MDW8136041.1 DNA polymerase III subunit gamma/tau [Thermodesulfobacterium sp.]
MSYLVLARRYRPKTFKEVVGQSHVVKTLVNALKQGKLSHALLFSGIKGTGKTTVARIVAKALNCKNLQDKYEPCNECLNCLEINKGIYVDVIEIDAASNRGIDQIRDLIENLKYSPAKGKAKVYIIDEVHMLTKEASNALLKSLEEPPSHVYFILATTEPNKLIPTILSRCQRYDFKRLDPTLITKYLADICQRENYEIDLSALEILAKEAQGSIRDALSLLDQAMAYGVKTKEDLISAFGWHEVTLVEELAKTLLERNFKEALKLAQKIYQDGIDLVYLMEKMTEFFRELLVMKTFPQESRFEFQTSALRKLVLESETEEILLIFQILLRDLEILKKSSYPQLQFELTLAKICEFEKLVPLKEVIQKLDTLIQGNFTGILSHNLDQSEVLSPFQDLNIKKDNLTWEGFLEFLKEENSPLYPLASSLPKPEITSEEVSIKIPSKHFFLNSSYVSLIKEKLEKFFNRRLNLEFLEESSKIFIEEVKERAEVKSILKIFSAKISYLQPLKE